MGKLLIPRLFHRIWLGPNPMPDEFAEYGQSWLKHHPGWQMITWTDKMMLPLQNQEAFDNAVNYAQKSDIARPELIYKFGGVYMDCDFECFKNIEPILQDVKAFAAVEVPRYISNAVIGCVPHSPVFKRIIDGIPDSIRENCHLPINHQAGPMYYDRMLKDCSDITIFEHELFYPYLWWETHRKGEVFPNAYAAHHWAASWLK